MGSTAKLTNPAKKGASQQHLYPLSHYADSFTEACGKKMRFSFAHLCLQHLGGVENRLNRTGKPFSTFDRPENLG